MAEEPSAAEADRIHLPVTEAQAVHRGAARGADAGPTLRLEAGADGVVNAGYWTDAADALIFAAVLPGPGRYQVALLAACTPGEAGSRVAVSAESGAELEGVVADTGGFQRYAELELAGALELRGGPVRLLVRVVALAAHAVMNLRALHLRRLRPVLAAAAAAPAGARIMGSAAAVLQAGGPVALLCRVVEIAGSELPPGGDLRDSWRRARLLDQAESELLEAEIAGPLLVDAAVAALRAGALVVARGELQSQAGRPLLRLQALEAPEGCSVIVGASAAELRDADARLSAWTQREELGARLLAEALGVLGLLEAQGLRAQAADGAPAGRLAAVARLLLMQALSGAEAPGAAPGSPRLHLAVLGPVPGVLASLVSLLDPSVAPGSAPPRAQAGALRGRARLRAGRGWTRTLGALRDGGSWLVPLDQAAWTAAGPRACLREVLEGRLLVRTEGPVEVEAPARCALVLLGGRRGFWALCRRGRGVDAALAALVSLGLDSVVHLAEREDPGERHTLEALETRREGEEEGGIEAGLAQPQRGARRLRVLLARLLDRTREVRLAGVAGELAELGAALEAVTEALLGPLLEPGEVARAQERQRGAAARLTVAAARLAGRVEAQPADVAEAWRALAFHVEHLRWLRDELLGSSAMAGELAEAAGERFAAHLARYGWGAVDEEQVVSEVTEGEPVAAEDGDVPEDSPPDDGVPEDGGGLEDSSGG